jgi:oxygen-independent coproporphyrinogen III oxidase
MQSCFPSSPGMVEARSLVRVAEPLVAKYDLAGPRYTSYPTALEWHTDFGPAEWRTALEECGRSPRPLSIYVHLPFCRRLCLFCGCNVVIRKDGAGTDAYLERVEREIDAVALLLGRRKTVSQLHWGGGTPTFFSAEQLEALFARIGERFDVGADAEVGVEVDPRVTSPEQVRRLRRLGFNRVSLGVQDLDPRVQRAVRRIQPFEQTRALFELCRALGFASINTDLIYGLPHQTPDSLARTVDRIIELEPDRVALYSYAHVPWLKKQQGAMTRLLPSPTEKLRLFCTGLERLLGAGYRFIGFDHFARPGDELVAAQRDGTLTRNFQGYTTRGGADLLAFGASAISATDRVYAQNARGVPAYEQHVDACGLAVVRGLRLSDDDLLRREVILRLLCNCRLSKAAIEADYGIVFDEYFAEELHALAELERDGLVRVSPSEIEVTLLGRIFLRVIGATFDAYLRRPGAARSGFSRTV